jgi:hypothetical protein
VHQTWFRACLWKSAYLCILQCFHNILNKHNKTKCYPECIKHDLEHVYGKVLIYAFYSVFITPLINITKQNVIQSASNMI